MVKAIVNDPVMCRRYVYLYDGEYHALEKYSEYARMNLATILKYIAICGGQRPLMRCSAATRRSLTATLVKELR